MSSITATAACVATAAMRTTTAASAAAGAAMGSTSAAASTDTAMRTTPAGTAATGVDSTTAGRSMRFSPGALRPAIAVRARVLRILAADERVTTVVVGDVMLRRLWSRPVRNRSVHMRIAWIVAAVVNGGRAMINDRRIMIFRRIPAAVTAVESRRIGTIIGVPNVRMSAV